MRRSRIAFTVASCGLFALPALAAGPESAAEVLARTRAAVGYDRIAAHPQGIQATGRAAVVGIDSSYSLLFSGPDAAIERIDGPITVAGAIDGEHTWVTDIGGETRMVEAGDRERTRFGLLIATHGALAPDAPLEFRVDEAASTARTISLPFTVRDALISGTLEVDRATSLPTQWMYTAGPTNSTVALADYVEFDGLKLAGHVRTTTTHGSEIEVWVTALAEAPVFIRSPYQIVQGRPADTVFDPAVPPEIEIVKAPTGHLLVHPLINGKDLGWFIFDTGAGNSVLSAPVVAELDLETFGDVPASGVGGVARAGFCRPDSLTLGPITMRQPLMVSLDLSFLDAHMGRRIAGLIGYNLLARSVARIDMATPAISLYEPATFKDPAIRWQKLVIDQRIPHVEASFEGHTGLFRLDTGAAQMSVSMHEPAVRTLKLLDGRETTESRAGGVGGSVPIRRGRLEWFELAGRRTENLMADFATEATGAFADPYSMGNIGGVLLSPYTLVTDYSNGRIAFVERPGEAPAPGH